MGIYKNLIDKLLKLQDRYAADVADLGGGERKCAFLNIVGVNGEQLTLKFDGARVSYASPDEQPTEIFQCSEDTFLDLLMNPSEQNFIDKVTMGYFSIMSADTREISLVDIEKWREGFARLGKAAKMALALAGRRTSITVTNPQQQQIPSKRSDC